MVMALTGWGQFLTKYVDNSEAWYKAKEATQIADNILLFQRNTGGWVKGNIYDKTYSSSERTSISFMKREKDSCFDNTATYTELEFLGRIYSVVKDERYRDAFNRGLDFIFEAQYANGGWPQFYPEYNKRWSRDTSAWVPEGLEHFITFNDDAIIGILRLLKKVSEGTAPYSFVDQHRVTLAKNAVERGIRCILKCQFIYNQKKTAWPAQLDEVTLEPRWARSFEPPSIALRESIDIVRFLLSINKPSDEIVDAVQSAVKWIDQVKVLNTVIVRGDTMMVIEQPNGIIHRGRRDVSIHFRAGAPPLWARFYELNTFVPLFASRDDTIRYKLSDISLERRSGYDWYGPWADELLKTEYPRWAVLHRVKNVLDELK